MRTELAKLRKDLDCALESVGKNNGFKITTGSISFKHSDKTASIKLSVVMLGEGGVERDLDAEAFKTYASIIGLRADDLGREIQIQGNVYTIAGYRPKARKNAIVIKSKEGKIYVTSVSTVLRQLAPKS